MPNIGIFVPPSVETSHQTNLNSFLSVHTDTSSQSRRRSFMGISPRNAVGIAVVNTSQVDDTNRRKSHTESLMVPQLGNLNNQETHSFSNRQDLLEILSPSNRRHSFQKHSSDISNERGND